jgi:hypothetical protein
MSFFCFLLLPCRKLSEFLRAHFPREISGRRCLSGRSTNNAGLALLTNRQVLATGRRGVAAGNRARALRALYRKGASKKLSCLFQSLFITPTCRK